MLSLLWSGIISTTLAISPIILLVLLVAPLLYKHYKPSLSCIVWLVIAIRLLVPITPLETPRIAIPIGEVAIYLSDETSTIASQFTESEPLPDETHGKPFALNSHTAISPFGMLAIVWLAGAISLALAHMVVHLHMKRKLLRWSIPINDENTLKLLEKYKKEQGICKNIALHQCGILTTPLLMGLFSPCILLPDTQLTNTQIRYVLLHELAHYRRRDLWFKLLLLLAKSVHWFNPLVWFAVKSAEVNIEIACDAEVLKLSGNATRKEYGNSILSFIQAKTVTHIPLTTNFFENHNQIIRRFEKIMDTKMKRNGILCIALIITAIILSTTLVGCVNAQAATPNTTFSNTSNAKIETPKQGALNIEQAAALSQDELKMRYLEDPEKYQAQQVAFQEAILLAYGSTNYKIAADQMTWPVAGHYNITAPFGWRYDGTDFHSGIDISDSDIDGNQVVAASDGTVVQVNTEYIQGKGYGIYVILDHGGNLATLYAHLGEVTVKQGDTLKAGQTIGKVGSTGFASEAQLHFEVRKTGAPDNVQHYLLPSSIT